MKPNSATPADILSRQNPYVVPVFQRFYRWEKPQWDKLWENLMELRAPESTGKHFMGFLVFFPETTPKLNQRLHVIDGQQRLTTLSLLLIAVRDTAEEKGFNDLAGEVTDRYLVDPHAEGEDYYRTLLKLRDRPEYEAAVRGQEAPDGRITSALSYFEGKLAELPELADAPGLRNFVALVTRRLEFMCATLEEDNAYNIFKSLNSTGVPLGAADLIRNFVFMNLRPEMHDEFDRRLWSPLERHFTRRNGVIDDDTLSAFMRDFLMRDGRLLRKEKEKVFEAFEDRYTSMGFSPESLATELNRFAEYYLIIRGERLDRHEPVTAALDQINRLKVSTAYPLLLQLFERRAEAALSDDDLATAIEAIVGFILRRYICALDTRAYGKTFTKACSSLGPSTLESLKAYLLQNDHPDDARFKNQFLTFNLYESQYGRFVLEYLEKDRGHREPADLAGADVDTPGNLALSAYNQAIANRTFAEKRAHYARSNIGITRELAKLERWGEAEIKARGQAMAEIAARLWVGPSQPYLPPQSQEGIRDLNPEDAGSLYHTHIIQGSFGQTRISNWRDLLDCAVRTASQKGLPFSAIEQIAAARDQDPGERNFHQVEGVSIWVRAMDANNCWQRSFRLAQRAGVDIYLLIEWEDTEGAANPGQKATLQWSPPPPANGGPR